MWSSEEEFKRQTKRETELNLSFRYLSPHSFTVLRPENQVPPPPRHQIPLPKLSPPENKHRLTPTIKRKRNTSFAIIADIGSNPVSRSPSPQSGRVSPFRGRGFNPAGSRHASPLPSPTVQKKIIHFESVSSSTPEHKPPRPDFHGGSSKGSRIPTLTRRDSNVGEARKRKHQSNLSKQLSQSLSNIAPRAVSNKPPQSPRNLESIKKGQKPTSAFEKLSPIVGSSPEPSPSQRSLRKQQSMSSPSKIPRSRSQPPSTRTFPSTTNSRVSSRSSSRNVSRNVSREASPSKSKTSYGSVKAKVDSFNTIKYKVPPKPQVPISQKPTNGSGNSHNNNSNSSSGTNISYKKPLSNNYGDSSKSVKDDKNRSKRPESKTREEARAVIEERQQLIAASKNKERRRITEESSIELKQEQSVLKETEKSKSELFEKKKNDSVTKPNESLPSTTAVVSSTTTTVTQPLKIEAKIDVPLLKADADRHDDSVYLPDGRALSATSVSTALNRMNNTVLDSKTLMQESTLPLKLHSSNATELSLGTKESKMSTTELLSATNKIGDSVKVSNESNKTETTHVKAVTNNGKSNATERTVIGISVLPKTAADEEKKIDKTVLTTHVEPIRIMVQEKPTNGDVQSGNVRFPASVVNGIAERPGLPPPQQPQEESQNTSTEPPKNVCGRLFGCCKKSESDENKKTSKLWCFKRKNEEEEDKETQSKKDEHSIESLSETKTKKWYQKLNCRKSSVTPSATTERKDSWIDSVEDVAEKEKRSVKDSCKKFFSTLFCLKLCKRKQKVADIQRKPSIMSKKKSLTPSIPPEEPKQKLDASLIEHVSVMKGAIPVLSVPLAWLCLILNVFLPGTGTIVSGFICLCTGKPRFSANDGAKQRFGAFLIDFFIGCGQLFTVLFCLVGWGWSIWWGVIMIKVAKKYRKIRNAERAMEEDRILEEAAAHPHATGDVERGS